MFLLKIAFTKEVLIMNRIILVLLLVCSAWLANAQDQYATTRAGRQVLLRADGSWEYVTTTNNNNARVNSLKSGTQNNNNSVRSVKRSTSSGSPRSTKASSQYIRGPRGGCYYINSNGNKTYVDRSLCN